MAEPLDIERLKSDPAYRAERRALHNGSSRKPIETTQQPEPTKPEVEAEKPHPKDLNQWFEEGFDNYFQSRFGPNFESHFNFYFESILDPLFKTIDYNIQTAVNRRHIDTLMLAALMRSMIGINKNSMRPDTDNISDVQAELDALRKSLWPDQETLEKSLTPKWIDDDVNDDSDSEGNT